MANNLNCVFGELPFKYLGSPVSDSHLTISAFSHVVQKIFRRMDPWKGNHLTSRGKHILTNSCIPIYYMGFYYLQDGVRK